MTAAELVQRAAVVAEAKTWIGTPWVHRARVKGGGVDCGQILAAVYESCGVTPHVDPGDYPQDWALHRSEQRFLEAVERWAAKVETPGPGDIALFRYGRCLSHAAIVVELPTVIHAYIGAGRVVVDDVRANTDLASRLAGFWSPWAKEM